MGQSASVPPSRQGNGNDMFVSRNDTVSAKADKEPTLDFEQLGPIWVAVAKGKVDKLANLLKTDPAGVNEQDEHGFTPLAVAIRYGNDAMVKLLLQTGKVDLNRPIADGKTPLILAARYGRKPILEQLLAHRAKLDLKAKDHRGKTALDWAKSQYNFKAVDLLKQAGAAA